MAICWKNDQWINTQTPMLVTKNKISSGKHRGACGWLCLVAACKITQPVGLRVLTGSKLGLNPLILALDSVRSTKVQGSYTTALKQDKILGLGAKKESYVHHLRQQHFSRHWHGTAQGFEDKFGQHITRSISPLCGNKDFRSPTVAADRF